MEQHKPHRRLTTTDRTGSADLLSLSPGSGLHNALAGALRQEDGTVRISGRGCSVSPRMVVILCPLYAPGTLADSTLIPNPGSISESRVGGKWTVYKQVMAAADDYLKLAGERLKVHAVFADRGILLAHAPGTADHSAADRHSEVYRAAFEGFCSPRGIQYTYSTFTDIGVALPRFFTVGSERIPGVDLEDPSLEQRQGTMIDLVNEYLRRIGEPTWIVNNNDNRKRMKDLLNMAVATPSMVFDLVAGYVAFDYRLPGIAGKTGMYLQAERMGQLLTIANFTDESRSMPRIDVLTV